ncbi:MAG: serine/threonine protein kinase, partial [Planctomycetes bacterium]|nr:serine/threonine protein kinase [Planctomycetota bacterium]
SLAVAFLREVEELGAVDALTLAPPRGLPRRLGDFRILGLLGSGGVGSVYEAEQISTGWHVALKCLHPHLAHQPSARLRFAREARLATWLRHPGTVRGHGLQSHGDSVFLVMDLLHGHSLHRLLRARTDPRDVDHARACAVLDDPKALTRVFGDFAAALAFTHRHGVVHRDVKPANLFVCTDGRGVLLDFGLACAPALAEAELTATCDFLGTPVYMSPEQAAGARVLRPSTDVYSLAAVLYECLAGEPLVRNDTLPVVLDAVRRARAPSVRRMTGVAPRALACLVRRCLRRNARWRPDAGSLAEALGCSVSPGRTSIAREFRFEAAPAVA